MSEITLYPEMNDEICTLLRGTGEAMPIYAATLIDQLREQVKHCKKSHDASDLFMTIDGQKCEIEELQAQLTTMKDAMSSVVTLCGSTKFKDEFLIAQRRLTLQGWIVLSVGMFGHADNEDITSEQKEKLDTLHLGKIDISARVHFINKDGYMGDSTKRELEYSKQHGKLITYEFDALAELDKP